MATSLKDIEISHIARYIFAVPYIKPGDIVLDACCGTGYGIKILTNFTHADKIEGFDASKEAIDIGLFHFSSNLTCSSFKDIELPCDYDVITCFEAIEHVDEPELLLKKLSKALKQDGTLILSSPNQTFMPWSEDKFPEHKRHFTFKQLSGMLNENGLKVDRVFSQQSKFISCINQGQIGRFMILVCKKL